MKSCFGLASVFAMDGKKCKECDSYGSCAESVLLELERLNPSLNLSKMIKKHKEFMEKNKLVVKETFYIPEPVQQPIKDTNPVTDLEQWLAEQNLIGEGIVADDVELEKKSPFFFYETVKYLRLCEKATPEQVINNLKYKMSDEEKAQTDPVQLASLCVQILHHNKIIQVTDRQIRWLI